MHKAVGISIGIFYCYCCLWTCLLPRPIDYKIYLQPIIPNVSPSLYENDCRVDSDDYCWWWSYDT